MLTSNSTQTDESVNSTLKDCTEYGAAAIIFIGFFITRDFLLVPLCSFVLYLGHQRWRQQRSFASTSHTDIFTYNLAVMEQICSFGGTIYICGTYTRLRELSLMGLYWVLWGIYGQMFIHILTCVERYLAVVHPVTYLGLRQSGGVKIRNISIACAWLLCFGFGLTILDTSSESFIIFVCSLVFALIIVSFCSLRVLCVLIGPGPGEVGGERERVDQSKQRAFHTVMAIMGVLWLWLVGFCVCIALYKSHLFTDNVGCALLVSGYWFSLPSSLVLPLIFLHRAGKLSCWH